MGREVIFWSSPRGLMRSVEKERLIPERECERSPPLTWEEFMKAWEQRGRRHEEEEGES